MTARLYKTNEILTGETWQDGFHTDDGRIYPEDQVEILED